MERIRSGQIPGMATLSGLRFHSYPRWVGETDNDCQPSLGGRKGDRGDLELWFCGNLHRAWGDSEKTIEALWIRAIHMDAVLNKAGT